MNAGYVVRVASGPATGTMAPVDRPLIVGREGDLLVADTTVSRRHLRVEPRKHGPTVTDLGSAAGTHLNGSPVVPGLAWQPGAELRLGRSTLRLLWFQRFHDAAASPVLVFDSSSADGRGPGPPGTGRGITVHSGLTIGRDPGCDVVLDDPSVSRHHAVVHVDDDGVYLEDQGSAAGTWLNQQRVHARAALGDGATIQFGTTKATFADPGAAAGPLSVRVLCEGAQQAEVVTMEASAESTVAEVTAELAGALDVHGAPLLLYRSEDGVLLHPEDRWCATGPQQGETLVLGTGDAAALSPAPGRRWPQQRRAQLNQLPRTVWPEPSCSVERIDPPESTSWKGRGVLWQLMGGIGAIAAGLVLTLVRPAYGAIGLIAGAVGLVTISASIFADQSRRRHAVSAYRSKLAGLDRTLTEAIGRQVWALRALSPTTDELEQWMRHRSPRVWERRPEHLDALRPTLGIGALAARLDIEPSSPTDSPLAGERDAVLANHQWLHQVPILGPGPAEGSLGLTGAPELVRQLTQRIVVEAAVLHPPHQLRIWVASTDPNWDWCRWLPHIAGGGPSRDLASAGQLLAELAAELADRSDTPFGHAPAEVLHLLVVPGSTRRLDLEVLRALRGRGLAVIAAADRAQLPNGLAVLVDVAADRQGAVLGAYPGAPSGDITVAGISDRAAERFAVALGRLTGAGAVRRPSGLLELLRLGPLDQLDVEQVWRRGPAAPLLTTVGVALSGEPVTIRFRRDGPHGMIAGTTGSGKSELLQTLLAGMAVTHPPEQLSLFLIDFKGGSTFAPLSPLPHVVGLVTDIEHDASLARRAFTALSAEIERRKRVLDRAGVPDIVAHERIPADERELLPNLLVVIDEFALLVEKQPEAKQRLDTIATQGRSLGIHLLLATQSPSGVISHAIRTNTNLWICLRVVTASESVEILGARDAARLPDDAPGRAIIRLGASDELQHFQAARVARPATGNRTTVRVTHVGGSAEVGPAATGRETTELQLLVDRIAATATARGAPPRPSLWLPPLPAVLTPGELPAPVRPGDRLLTLLGLADHPEQQIQQPFMLDLSTAGNALISGMLGYGRTATLLQIGADLAEHFAPDQLHIYGIDAGTGSLGPLAALPHVGSVVGASDVERLTRLLDRLTALVDRRRDRLAAAGAGNFLRWRAAGCGEPWVVLLVDDHATFREVAEQIEMGRLLERFNSLLQNGPAVGIHLVVSISQATDLRLRELNLVPARLVLRSADPADYDLTGARVSPADVANLPPGRALAKGAVELQVCWRDPDKLTALTHPSPAGGAESLPRPVLRLPITVARTEITAPGSGVLIGLGGTDVEAVRLDLDDGIPALLVAGPLRSGRSTALLSLLQDLRGRVAATTLIVTPRPSPLRVLAGHDHVAVASEPEHILAALDTFSAGPAGRVLVLDDAETLAKVFGASDRLEAVLRDADATGTRVLVAARSNDLPGLFDPWARYLVSLRRAVLLQPTADDAFLFGARLPTIPPPSVAGRGVVVDGARVTVVQVAAADLVAPAATG